jgi:hypothetical protein
MSPIPGTEQTPPAGAMTAVVLAVPVVFAGLVVLARLPVPLVLVVLAMRAVAAALVMEAVAVVAVGLAVLLAPRTLAEA